MEDFCFVCYMLQFSHRKYLDPKFFKERAGEFFDEEEFKKKGAPICAYHREVHSRLMMEPNHREKIDEIKKRFESVE